MVKRISVSYFASLPKTRDEFDVDSLDVAMDFARRHFS